MSSWRSQYRSILSKSSCSPSSYYFIVNRPDSFIHSSVWSRGLSIASMIVISGNLSLSITPVLSGISHWCPNAKEEVRSQ